MLKSADGRAGVTFGFRSRSLLQKIEIKFPVNNLIELRPIDVRLGLLVAYVKRQLGIATQVSLITSNSAVITETPIYYQIL